MKSPRSLLHTGITLAFAIILLSTTGLPGVAYVDAYTKELAEIYGANVSDFYVWDTHDGTGSNGVITSSYAYPLVATDPTNIMVVGSDTVAAWRDMSGYAQVDARAGTMKAYAYSSMYVWGKGIKPIAPMAHSGAYTEINENFVLSQAATITLAGTLHGILGGDQLIYDNYESWDPAVAGLGITISYPDGTEGGVRSSVNYAYRNKGEYNETFSLDVALPANVKINFRASLSAESSVAPNVSGILQLRGITQPDSLTSVGGETYADLSQTASFKLLVPEGVTLRPYNSGSELLLPVQTVPEPSTLLAFATGIVTCGLGLLRRRK